MLKRKYMYLCYILIFLIFELYIGGVTLNTFFSCLLPSFQTYVSNILPGVVCNCGSCIFIVAYYSTKMYMPHFTLDGSLGCFQFLADMNVLLCF